jgi:Uma2 family endonuclease
MAVSAELVSVEQYSHTSFEHDVEFVEGRIAERPEPTWRHSAVQGFLIRELWTLCRRPGLFAMPEQRVQTRPDRFRVPDVCVVGERPTDLARGIVTLPPYLCVEILSPEDSMAEALEKALEYLNFGVEWVWVIDPESLSGQVYCRTGAMDVGNGIFSTERFSLDLSGVEF